MPQQRSVGQQRNSECFKDREVDNQFTAGVRGKRHDPRLVELRFADQQRLFDRIPVTELQPGQLAAAQSGRVQEHDRKAEDFWPQRGVVRRFQCLRRRQDAHHFLLGEDMRANALVFSGELRGIGHEARWLRPTPVQHEVPRHPHL